MFVLINSKHSQATDFLPLLLINLQGNQIARRNFEDYYNRRPPKMDRFDDIYSSTPPAPPPKPGSHEVSRMSTPITTQSPRAAPPPPDQQQLSELPDATGAAGGGAQPAQVARPQAIPDPGDQWLPKILEDKSCVHQSPPIYPMSLLS